MVLEKMRRRAVKIAAKSKCKRYRHGATIFFRNRVISSSCNLLKTHPLGSGVNSNLHAEVRAILQALRNRKNLKGCSIYVVRINNQGELKLSKPCKSCANLIKSVGLTRVYWSE